MDIHKIKKLIELVEKSSISKLDISEGNKKIRIIRSKANISSIDSSIFSVKKSLDVSSNLSNPNTQKNFNNKAIPDQLEGYTVRSPMVGIFYRSSHPNEKPFVSIGQFINTGDTLCIIEAMKIMNQIQSDRSGIIQAILVDNGRPVEFDEPLLIIKQPQEHH